MRTAATHRAGPILLGLAWLLAGPGGAASGQEVGVEVLSGDGQEARRAGDAPSAASPVGQEPGIRVVELFHPETGTRERRVVAELTPPEIAAVQEALAEVGFPGAEERGVLGSGTRTALKRFQQERGLAACGCPSYETVLSLGLRPRVMETVVVSRPPPDEPELFRRAADTEVLYGRPAPPPPATRPSSRPPEPAEAERAAAPYPEGARRRAHPAAFHPLAPIPPDTTFGPLPLRELGERHPRAHPGLRMRRPPTPGTRVPMPRTRVPMPPVRPPIRGGGGG